MASNGRPVIPAPIPPSKIARHDQKVCYRHNNSLGRSLVKTLEDMKTAGKLTEEVCEKILIHFDMRMKLASATPRMRFRCEEVVNVKEVDKVYTCILKQSQFNIKGIGFTNNDNATISNVGEVKLEMWPSAGKTKRHGSTIRIGKEKVQKLIPPNKESQAGGSTPGGESGDNPPTGNAPSTSVNFEDDENNGDSEDEDDSDWVESD